MKISLCNFSVAYESRFPHTCLCVEDPFRFRIFHSVSNDVTDASLSITTNRRENRIIRFSQRADALSRYELLFLCNSCGQEEMS